MTGQMAASQAPILEPVRAAYVHIPFCVQKCAYCDFASYAGRLGLLPAYVDALLHEVALTSAGLGPALRAPLASVFLGGGTPSLLAPADLARLLDTLARSFGFTSNVEITVEANPGTLDLQRMAAYRAAGCNRISIGVQTMAPHLLRLLGRIHEPDEAAAAVRQADAAGFRRISADLMFGLPGQTLDDVAETARQVLALPVTHLSFYSLSLEPGTPFHARYADHPELLPDDETERAQYACLIEAAGRAGLRHYEISNAACRGEECRHNLVYWRAEPYFGFGAGAHSYVGGVRRGNSETIDTYMERIATAADGSFATAADGSFAAAADGSFATAADGSFATAADGSFAAAADGSFAAAETADRIGRAEQEREFMLLGLRLLDGVDSRDYRHRFGGDLMVRFGPEIGRLTARGLLERSGPRLRLTRLGLDLANQVFLEFV